MSIAQNGQIHSLFWLIFRGFAKSGRVNGVLGWENRELFYKKPEPDFALLNAVIHYLSGY
jgi:hypothetical protein